jgi:hypothetical protein
MGSFVSFGTSIPVTGPNIGFPGNISRFGERVIAARLFTPANAANTLLFGAPAVEIPDATGGHFTSVADFIAAATTNIGLLAQYFAGFAVREVKTQLAYPYNPGITVAGFYTANQMSEVLERGNVTVTLAVNNSAENDSQIYTRVVGNTAVAAGLVGDVEAGTPVATDLFTVATTLTAGSTAATIAAANANIKVGQLLSGAGIAPGTYVAAVAGTAVTLSQAATATFATEGSVVTYSNLFAIPGCVARTGYVDANSVIEVTILERIAA